MISVDFIGNQAYYTDKSDKKRVDCMGTEFNHLFDEWAQTYDTFIAGENDEYRDVFLNYDHILQCVVEKSFGSILEFGVGTGNLTKKFLDAGFKVLGIEPSREMRLLAKQKLPKQAVVIEGDFLQFETVHSIDTIVSTYAFHHLTDEEKRIAIKKYSQILNPNGKIVFADTMFTNQEAFDQTIQEAVNRNFHQLANDLQTEYYTLIPIIQSILEDNGFRVSFSRQNHFVWIVEAIKN